MKKMAVLVVLFLLLLSIFSIAEEADTSTDTKTMLSEHALKAYQMTNSLRNFRIPEFIGYLEFKRWLI